MRSIKSYILFTSVLVAALILGLLTLYRYFFEIPKETKALEAVQLQELISLDKFIQHKKNRLANTVQDWAHWDDSYEFLLHADEHERYVQRNITADTFVGYDLVGMVFLNTTGEVHYSQGFDHRDKELIPLDSLVDVPGLLLTERYSLKNAMISGWLATQLGPAIYAMSSVHDSALSTESAGFLVFIQLLTPTEIDFVESIARLSLNFTAIDPHTSTTEEIPNLSPARLVEGLQAQRSRVIRDTLHNPVMLIDILHTASRQPRLLDTLPVLLLITALVTLFFIGLMERLIHRPMKQHVDQLEQMIAQQALQTIDTPFKIKELEQFRSAFNLAIDLVRQQQHALEGLSYLDSLTEIANRRSFEQFASKAWNEAKRHDTCFCFAILDIDYFKQFNDSLGHVRGDLALKSLGALLKECFTRNEDFFARLGGEEFVIILRSARDDFSPLLKHFHQRFEALQIEHPARPDHDPYLTISMGAVIIKHPNLLSHDVSLDTLYTLADQALYQAKHLGRNRVQLDYPVLR